MKPISLACTAKPQGIPVPEVEDEGVEDGVWDAVAESVDVKVAVVVDANKKMRWRQG